MVWTDFGDDPSDSALIRSALLKAFDGGLGRTYAVVDGAQFDDLPALLASAELNHRSLYLGAPDEGLMRASPFLVDPYLPPPTDAAAFEPDVEAINEALRKQGHDPDALDTDGLAASAELTAAQFADWIHEREACTVGPRAYMERLLGIVGDRPAIVLWSGDTDAGLLFKHLRSINRAILPPDPDEWTEDGKDVGDGESYLFRHYDGRVLAEVLPVLDAGQFARVFGPARRLTFTASSHEDRAGNPVRMAEAPADLIVTPTPGPLRLSEEQIEAIEERRLRAMHRRIMEPILARKPYTDSPFTDEELSKMGWRAMRIADEWGVEGEEAFEAFVLMEIISRGAATNDPVMQQTMRTSGDRYGTPDERIMKFKRRFDELIRRDFGERYAR